ncbi:threonine/homoserine/homoserine lactone efflux protein [Azospirillum brasilense]|uniref:Threonine/homoserine/homoserine lactone efflux protein n=1 Tax=Azospirillum brasilense TaxID=192 RepID=A0A560CC51_AZOBR|nr:threonine/homoserine/homoserine lactone efflux protein [Azospirillum brasilense]
MARYHARHCPEEGNPILDEVIGVHGLVVLLQGIVLGIAIAAPVGPIGLLCIRRTLQHGPLMGFFTGFGAAVADTIYGAIAAFGVSAALDFLQGHEIAFQLVGGIFLIVVAIRTFRQKPEDEEREAASAPDTPSFLGGFMTGLSLTLTNPATIMAFIAIFAGFGLGGNLGRVDASTLVAGVFIGASLWWLALSMGVAAVRHRISDRGLTRLNHCTGVALAAFGIWALGMAFTGMASWAMG